MSLRIIRCEVRDEHLLGTDTDLGTAGSHDDVLLELRFSPFWEGTAKTVQWRCNAAAPVRRVLTEDLLASDSDHIYRVPVPPEAKQEAGVCFVTVRGVVSEGSIETRASLTAQAAFRVLPSVWDVNAGESQDVSASLGDQLLIEIQRLRDYISDRRRLTPVTLADCAIYAAGHGNPNSLAEMIQGDECPNAAKHSFVAYYDADGDQWIYRCRHCGKPGSEVLLGTYTDYSASLPHNEIDNTGGFIWRPTVEDIISGSVSGYHETMRAFTVGFSSFPFHYGTSIYYDHIDIYVTVYDEHTIQIRYTGSPALGHDANCLLGHGVPETSLTLRPPVTGAYTLLDGPKLSVTRYRTNAQPYYYSGKYSGYNVYHGSVSSPMMADPAVEFGSNEIMCWYELPIYSVVADIEGPVDAGGGIYGPAGRAGSLHGLFGYYSDGEIVPVNGLIVDESAGTVFDPVHDMFYNMTSWSYDYATRTYYITAETGESITVNFGEETVNIDVDGDSATVYYLIRAGQST